MVDYIDTHLCRSASRPCSQLGREIREAFVDPDFKSLLTANAQSKNMTPDAMKYGLYRLLKICSPLSQPFVKFQYASDVVGPSGRRPVMLKNL